MTEILAEQPETSTADQQQREASLLEQIIAENLAFRRALNTEKRHRQAIEQQCDRLVNEIGRQKDKRREYKRLERFQRKQDLAWINELQESCEESETKNFELREENEMLRTRIETLKARKTITKTPFPRRMFAYKK
jgi:hypothetical protein